MKYPNILFWLNRDRAGEGKARIYCRITLKGRKNFSTGSDIELWRWDETRKRVKGSKPDAWRINKNLIEIEHKLLDLFTEHKPSTAEDLVNLFLGNVEIDTTLRTFFGTAPLIMDSWNLASSTKRGYDAAYKLFKAFLQDTYDRYDIALDKVDPYTALSFEKYLDTYTKDNGSPLEPSSRLIYLHKVTALMTAAKKMKFIKENPLEGYEPETTIKKLMLLENLNRRMPVEASDKWNETRLTFPHLEHSRIAFKLQMVTGMAYKDLYTHDWNNPYSYDQQARKVIAYHREKNGNLAIIPVTTTIDKVVQEAQNIRMVVPLYSTYMNQLEEICKILKIDKVTSHDGRHIFGTDMLVMGYSMESVSRMMGHSSIRETEKTYAKINVDKLYNDVKRLNLAV